MPCDTMWPPLRQTPLMPCEIIQPTSQVSTKLLPHQTVTNSVKPPKPNPPAPATCIHASRATRVQHTVHVANTTASIHPLRPQPRQPSLQVRPMILSVSFASCNGIAQCCCKGPQVGSLANRQSLLELHTLCTRAQP
jgi:hypothetical protein